MAERDVLALMTDVAEVPPAATLLSRSHVP